MPVDSRRDACRLVLPDGIAYGHVTIANGLIASIELREDTRDDILSASDDPSATLRLDGEYLIPGLVEPHTDNVERHLLPRPSARWPNTMAAVLAHDAELATAGITTVFDSLRIGEHEGEPVSRRDLFPLVAEAVAAAKAVGALRIDHRLHARCELPDPVLFDVLEPLLDDPAITLMSLMDHTPGQRQWRDVDALRRHKGNENTVARDRSIADRIAIGQRHVEANRRRIVARLAPRVRAGTMTLASHDDTTLEHVDEAVRDGIAIAEFPCTLAAARAAVEQGMFTLGGSPNIVRGGSHSGNVAVRDLVGAGALSGLSSDYVPASTLQAVVTLAGRGDLSFARAVALATSAPAACLGLRDRGQIVVGSRADLVQLRIVDGTPVVVSVQVAGRRVA